MLSGTSLDILRQIPANENNLMIPSKLVTIERDYDMIDKAKIVFMTPHIAHIVNSLQQGKIQKFNSKNLEYHFHNPDTCVAAGKLFQKMFLEKFKEQDPDLMPPCYELGETVGGHPQSSARKSEEATMPWEG